MNTQKLRRNVSVRFFVAFFTVALPFFATGCTKAPTQNAPPPPSTVTENEGNPFEKQQGEEFLPSSLQHSSTAAKLDENGDRLPFQYDGGEFNLPYTVSAAGKAKNVGFLVFVDGIPQPYRINTADAPYEYMHIFTLSEDDVPTPFSFIFTPVAGKKGDNLSLTVVSVYNPSFQPDMKDTMSFGMYHSTLPAEFRLAFAEDSQLPLPAKISTKACIQNAVISTKPITDAALAALGGGMRGDVSLEDLNTGIFTKLLYNSAEKPDNLNVESGKPLHISFSICGIPGAVYKTTFYVNHQPISAGIDTAFETALTKGNMSVIEADIDTSELGDLNTFYAISVPTNAEDFPNAVMILEKSPSILIYK